MLRIIVLALVLLMPRSITPTIAADTEHADAQHDSAVETYLLKRSHIWPGKKKYYETEIRQFKVELHKELRRRTNDEQADIERRERISDLRNLIAQRQAMIDAGPSGTRISVNLNEPQPGDVGYIPWPVEVRQVLGPQDMLVDTFSGPIWITGYSTDGYVDEELIRLKNGFLFKGTKTYSTVLGASKAVFLYEALDLDSLLLKYKLSDNDHGRLDSANAKDKSSIPQHNVSIPDHMRSVVASYEKLESDNSSTYFDLVYELRVLTEQVNLMRSTKPNMDIPQKLVDRELYIREQLHIYHDSSPPIVPVLDLDELDIGQVGWFEFGKQRAKFEIIQIVNDSEMIISGVQYIVRDLQDHNYDFTPVTLADTRRVPDHTSSGQRTLWLRDVSTAGFADERSIKLHGVYHMVRATTYETVLGGTKTIYVIEPVPIAQSRLFQRQTTDTENVKQDDANKPPNAEQLATQKLELAKLYIQANRPEHARRVLRQVIEDYNETNAADKADRLLNSLNEVRNESDHQ